MSMSIEEAIRILDPETSADAIAEIKYYAGFNKDKPIEKVNEACVVACDVMREYKNRNQIFDEVSNALTDYFSEHAHEVWDRVSARDFICDNIEVVIEKLKSECPIGRFRDSKSQGKTDFSSVIYWKERRKYEFKRYFGN